MIQRVVVYVLMMALCSGVFASNPTQFDIHPKVHSQSYEGKYSLLLFRM